LDRYTTWIALRLRARRTALTFALREERAIAWRGGASTWIAWRSTPPGIARR